MAAISGMCPCGGHLKDLSHTIKGHATAVQWDSSIRQQDMPVRIDRKACTACGREDITRIHRNYHENNLELPLGFK